MKATKEQIIAEANRRRAEHGEGAPPVEHFIVDVVCENWTPPEPVDPDVLAFREWFHERLAKWDPASKEATLKGRLDNSGQATAFLAGARMAREQERERARVLLLGLEDIVDTDQDEISHIARVALAKYRGEA